MFVKLKNKPSYKSGMSSNNQITFSQTPVRGSYVIHESTLTESIGQTPTILQEPGLAVGGGMSDREDVSVVEEENVGENVGEERFQDMFYREVKRFFEEHACDSDCICGKGDGTSHEEPVLMQIDGEKDSDFVVVMRAKPSDNPFDTDYVFRPPMDNVRAEKLRRTLRSKREMCEREDADRPFELYDYRNADSVETVPEGGMLGPKREMMYIGKDRLRFGYHCVKIFVMNGRFREFVVKDDTESRIHNQMVRTVKFMHQFWFVTTFTKKNWTMWQICVDQCINFILYMSDEDRIRSGVRRRVDRVRLHELMSLRMSDAVAGRSALWGNDGITVRMSYPQILTATQADELQREKNAAVQRSHHVPKRRVSMVPRKDLRTIDERKSDFYYGVVQWMG